jgi:hypothetical protein
MLTPCMYFVILEFSLRVYFSMQELGITVVREYINCNGVRGWGCVQSYSNGTEIFQGILKHLCCS